MFHSITFVVISDYPNLALPFVETLSFLGTASVRKTVQTAQDYPKHPGVWFGKSRLDSDRRYVQGLPLLPRQIRRREHQGRYHEKNLRRGRIRRPESVG